MNSPPSPQSLSVSFGRAGLVGPVLERLVSASAARADLPVNRLFDALAAVDSLVHALDDVLGDEPRTLGISIAPGTVKLSVEGLAAEQLGRVRDATVLPGLGDVLTRTATAVKIAESEAGAALTITLE